MQCPQASFCSPRSGAKNHLPTWLEPYLQRAVTVTSTSTIRIYLANASEPSSLDNDELPMSDELIAENDFNHISSAYGMLRRFFLLNVWEISTFLEGFKKFFDDC